MKLSRKLSIFFMLLGLSILFIAPSTAKAATVGSVLTAPESGWQRFDDMDSKFVYNGNCVTNNTASYSKNFYKGTAHKCTSGTTTSITFKFYGTKLRLISDPAYDKRTDNIIIIDGVTETFSENSSSDRYQCIVYEKLTGLSEGIHTVTIKPSSLMTASQNLYFDAIDIDESGYLIDVNQPTKLVGIPGNSSATLSWDAIDGATSYNIKRSLTAGGPYTTLETITATTYTDLGLTNGTTYYYVVTVVTSTGESPDSNEVSVTPSSLSNAVLDIYLDNGMMKEYNVTPTELDAFLTWYDNKSNGIGGSYYIFTVKGTVTPFKSVKNYIPFSKILYFDVKEYE